MKTYLKSKGLSLFLPARFVWNEGMKNSPKKTEKNERVMGEGRPLDAKTEKIIQGVQKDAEEHVKIAQKKGLKKVAAQLKIHINDLKKTEKIKNEGFSRYMYASRLIKALKEVKNKVGVQPVGWGEGKDEKPKDELDIDKKYEDPKMRMGWEDEWKND